MIRKVKAGVLLGTALVAGIEHENPKLKTETQQTLTAAPTVEIVFGRLDDNPESWPYAPITYRGIVAVLTTSTGPQ